MGMLGEADEQTHVEWQQSVPGREQMPLRGTSLLPILCPIATLDPVSSTCAP